jgi:hypothetical protein
VLEAQVKLSFIPADLHLTTEQDGQFTVSLQGTEVLRTTSSKKALSKFNEFKRELEVKFPTQDLSAEEKAKMLHHAIADWLVKHNSMKPEQKKSTARSTRTFG